MCFPLRSDQDVEALYGRVPWALVDEEEENLRAWSENTDLVSTGQGLVSLGHNMIVNILFMAPRVVY